MIENELTQTDFNQKYKQLIDNQTNLLTQDCEEIIKFHLQGVTNKEIAEKFNCEITKITRFIQDIYEICFQEKVDRRKENTIPNLCKFLLKYKPELISYELRNKYGLNNNFSGLLSYPSDPEPLNSTFYLDRGFTSQWFEDNLLRNRLIRMKSSHKTGKTSLLMRIIDFAKIYHYSLVNLTLLDADTDVLTDRQSFYQWFFTNITEQLEIENTITDYSQANCVKFFEKNILKYIESPLFLVIDDLDKIFLDRDITENFASLLRSFFNKGSHNEKWKKLHLLIAYSTDYYVELDINKSPFNVGFPITLPEFTVSEISELAKLYQLEWEDTDLKKLITLIGGHPFLMRLTMYYCVKNNLTLPEIINQVTSNFYHNIYSDYLQELAYSLENNPQLYELFKTILKSNKPVELTRKDAYLLESLGLVTMENNQPKITCDLYKQYFSRLG
jgi:hypothetical protein